PVLDPIISQRIRVKIEPGKSARLSFITIASETSETLTELIEKNKTPEAVEGAFRLAQTRSQVEARYLNMKAAEIELYQDIISHILFISPLRRLNQEIIAQNSRGQQSLWAYGISGDLPIVLVVLKKSDEVDMLYEVLKMHEYWRIKDLKADLVILNDEENSYTHPLKALLSDIITSSHAHDIINKPGGIFILNWNNMPREDICLFHAAARFVVKGDSGTLADQLKKVQGIQLPKYRHFIEGKREYPSKIPKELELQYFNGMGGFSRDGKEYVLRLEKGQNTPMPWINVIANRNFGFIVSEAGSGYTWFENSRENKLSPWSNDPVSDTPGEVLYLSDYDTGELWTVTPLPIREEETYIITHGFGYTSFEHISHGIEQSMVQFVPVNDTVKMSLIKIKNISKFRRNLALTYYHRPVLGVSDQFTSMHIKTMVGESGEILIGNPYNEEFKGRVAYLDVSEKERSFTGDRKEFFGNGKLCSPDALKRQKLSGTLGTGYDPCAAVQTIISLDEGEEKELVFIMGMSQGADKVGETIEKFRNIDNVHNALTEVRNFWADKLDNLQVETPDASMNLLLNGWLLYQVVACRIWARTAFYQAGGAYGFRDQLQDSLAAVQVWPELARNQILLHSQHQFLEGDVQHWWHEPQNKGTRTRFSDDLLWMPYTVSQYVQVTGDYGILDETRVFLEDEPLKEFEDERYSVPKVSSQQSSIYDHCIRAIDRSLKFGEHGLPLIGSGDWNDGMNTVGNRGFGESVWLGWFLYTILKAFAPICVGMGDNDKALEYGKTAERLSQAIDKDAWDGNWYRRAYFDNGIPLGSIQNTECKIDSIAQTWAVISGGGRSEKIGEAMNSLENYLVLKEEGLIKLLTPPFDEGDLQPGYIKGYVPGVRENGGQYTHAAAWAIIAFALLGEGDKACELFNLINPVNHTRTHMEYSRYKAEPYVMAADVYAAYPHVGRGGWTWYTGSAGWMYRAGIEYLLGFKKNGSILKIEPCIPEKWTRFGMIYKYSGTIYKIDVQNPEGVSMGTVKTVVDGAVTSNGEIQLVDDGREHVVVVYMGKGES
ncbi:MAG: glycosyl transferase, partial [Bacillota bacterium]|nr:glycosyl transferase [Bacillota bacterium]